MRFVKWLRTVPVLVIVGSILFVVLATGGGLLLWGSNFAGNIVHTQLAEQQIAFPAAGAGLDARSFPGLQQYAGQLVDNGPKAKAYANELIRKHLLAVAGGKTYAQVSAQIQAVVASGGTASPALLAQQDTLFRGETLRGLLLNVWGWGTMGVIAGYVGIASLLGAFIVFSVLSRGFVLHKLDTRRATAVLDLNEIVGASEDAKVPVSQTAIVD
jgi:hypothetical protein